ncbi:MAG: isoprenylcysteine carboxylmethyltransferase family protein [Minisyncoccia bacterium]
MYDYGYVIVASWLVLIVVWALGALTAKPDVHSSPRVVRWLWQIPLLALLIFALLQNPHDDALFLERRFFNFGPAVGWIGALLTIIGVAFAIWARYKLGRNWGSNTKKDHVLVMNGPYVYVRHPLYTGAMLGLFGGALTGSIVGIVMFMVSIVFSLLRIHKEERVMLNLFPGQYPSYQARTKKVIPFVW